MIRYTARWVIPVTSAPVRDGTVAVEGSDITYVGPRAKAPAGGTEVDLGDAWLLPGLVNAHTHLELTAMRGFLEETHFKRWLQRLTLARARVLDAAAMLASARCGIAEGLLAGITTYADTSATPAVFDALLGMNVRGISYQEVFGPHPLQCDESMRELAARLDALRARKTALVRLGVSPHAPYSVSNDLYRAATAYARECQLPLAVHIAESRAETDFLRDGTGPFADNWRARGIPVAPRAQSSVALLRDLGVLDARPLLIHALQLTAADLDAVALARCPVVHCPASNAKFGHGIAPVSEMTARGTVVALGSDSVASNNRMDLLDEARLALLLARAAHGPVALDSSHAFEWATLGGARALGLGDVVGALQPGKQADLAAFPIDPLRDEPVQDPVAGLMFGASGRRALLVTVAGRELVRDGQLLANMEADIRAVRRAGELLARFVVEGGLQPDVDFSAAPAAPGPDELTATESPR